jgi:hypothetical protein
MRHAHLHTGDLKVENKTRGSPIRQARAIEGVQGVLGIVENRWPEDGLDDRQRPLLLSCSER